MALSDDRLQEIILNKDIENAEWGESWVIIDGTLVIFDGEGMIPSWLKPVLEDCDDDFNTGAEEVLSPYARV